MRVLALVSEAFGGYGGIAQYNRDLFTAMSAFAAKPVEPLLDIGRIADLARFAVVDHADARLRLAVHDVCHGIAHLLLQRRAVRLASVALLERLQERRWPRQATRVRAENVLS